MVERIVTSYHSPRKLIPMRWKTSGTVYAPTASPVNPFSVTSQDPNVNNFPWWYATGRALIDGNMTIALEGGFTPPISLIVWEWNESAQAWFRLGPNAGIYEVTYDTTYAQGTFLTSEGASILVQSSAVITGTAYTDAAIGPASVGAPQEG